jgi:hypothetical protein
MNINKTDNLHKMCCWSTFMQPLLLCKSNKYYIGLFWASVCSVSYHALYWHVYVLLLVFSCDLEISRAVPHFSWRHTMNKKQKLSSVAHLIIVSCYKYGRYRHWCR